VYGHADKRDADTAKSLTLDEARRIASNIAKLPTFYGGRNMKTMWFGAIVLSMRDRGLIRAIESVIASSAQPCCSTRRAHPHFTGVVDKNELRQSLP
jgi:hypothetical protein